MQQMLALVLDCGRQGHDVAPDYLTRSMPGSIRRHRLAHEADGVSGYGTAGRSTASFGDSVGHVTRSQARVFKTPYRTAPTGDDAIRTVEVSRATCAAPAYFPLMPISGNCLPTPAWVSTWRPQNCACPTFPSAIGWLLVRSLDAYICGRTKGLTYPSFNSIKIAVAPPQNVPWHRSSTA